MNTDTQKTAEPDLPYVAAWIGIDWADERHAYTMMANAPGAQHERGSVEHTPEDLEQWITKIKERFSGKPVAVALEQSRGPLVTFLLSYDWLRIFPINPVTAAKYRQALHPSGAKSDPADSDLLLDIIRLHRSRLRPLFVPDEQTRLIAALTEDRRHLVDERTKCVQQVIARLKDYFPVALETAGLITTNVGPSFLLKWPTLAKAQAAKPHVLRKFFYGHNSRAKVEERIAKLKQATPLTRDAAIIEAGERYVQTLAQKIVALNKAIHEYDARIAQLYKSSEDKEIFDSLPAGEVMKPRLMAEFGTDRNRYQSAAELQALSGIAPVQRSSGKSMTVRTRVACPKHTKQTFHEFAKVSLMKSAWARGFYAWKRSQGKDHHAALRSLAFKWERIIFACWSQSSVYDEAKHIKRLKEKKAPYLHLIA